MFEFTNNLLISRVIVKLSRKLHGLQTSQVEWQDKFGCFRIKFTNNPNVSGSRFRIFCMNINPTKDYNPYMEFNCDKDVIIIECDMMKEETDPGADFRMALAKFKEQEKNKCLVKK